jgi:hypothetical protein
VHKNHESAFFKAHLDPSPLIREEEKKAGSEKEKP